MYNFIFWFIYKFFEKRQDIKSIFLASSFTALVILIHLLLLFCIVTILSGTSIQSMQGSYVQRKAILFPFVFLFFIMIYFAYYKWNSLRILSKYEKRDPFSSNNFSVFFVVSILPLILVLILSSFVPR